MFLFLIIPYPEKQKALSNISFNLMPSEFLAVVGPSGCGKSTLLNLICGMLLAEEGTILMNGIPPSPGDPRIGYMLQKDHLLEWRTIYQNVILGLEIRNEKTPEKLAYIEEMIDTYGLDKFRTARPSQLSGGMRQRAALIRTLALKPDLLLLDEPFSALDYQTRLNVSDDIGRILKKENKPAILVTHDISEAISMADRVIILTNVLPMLHALSQSGFHWMRRHRSLHAVHRNLNPILILYGRS